MSNRLTASYKDQLVYSIAKTIIIEYNSLINELMLTKELNTFMKTLQERFKIVPKTLLTNKHYLAITHDYNNLTHFDELNHDDNLQFILNNEFTLQSEIYGDIQYNLKLLNKLTNKTNTHAEITKLVEKPHGKVVKNMKTDFDFSDSSEDDFYV